MAPTFNNEFVSKKINKVRFQPITEDTFRAPVYTLATGSWGDSKNYLSLYSLSSDYGKSESAENELKLLSEHDVTGDITALEFCGNCNIVTGLLCGLLEIYEVRSHNLNIVSRWNTPNNAPVSDISCSNFSSTVLVCTENGLIAVLDIEKQIHSKLLTGLSGQGIYCCQTVMQNEVVVGTSSGSLHVFDLREPSETRPSNTYSVSAEEQVGITSLDVHPAQRHIVCGGCEDGALAVWDLRSSNEGYPAVLLSSHSAAVTDVKFRSNKPEEAFTSSQDGSVLWWKYQPKNRATRASKSELFASNPWLEPENNILSNDSLLPSFVLSANSIDVMNDVLVCGTDNEALFIISDLSA